jgi:hypothetical protein
VFAYGNRLVGPGSPDYFATDRCKIQPAVYGAIVEAASWLMIKVDPLYTRAQIWFDEGEIIQPLEACPVRLGHVANSIASTAWMGYVARAFPLPGVEALPDSSILALAGEDRILVVISNTPTSLDVWRRRFDALELVHTPIASHRVQMLASGFTMHAWRVSPRSAQVR